jgi:hypothetical protein
MKGIDTNMKTKLPLLLVLFLLIAAQAQAQAQAGGATLSGTVTDTAGAAVANANLTIKNAAAGQSVEAQTDSAGKYTVPNLTAGDYEVSIVAEGFATQVSKVTLAAGTRQSLNLTLLPPGAAPPSLKDLGFAPAQTQGNAQAQALLDKRSHMLKIHQRLGLITTAPLIATLIVSNQAAGKKSTASGRELHAALGGVTAGMYLTTAYFAVFAPKVPGTTTRGPIRVHKALAWIHGPGMILTPILGAMAYDQRNRGEKVHGIASAHGAVAAVTGVAYGAALLSVTIKF